jgi:hypothetical protein
VTNLLHPNLTFNLSAIMKAAVVIARTEHAYLVTVCPGKKGLWQQAMSAGLRRAWITARIQRQDAVKAAEAAMLSTQERAVADLQAALSAADMIDNTATCFATKAAISAQIHQLSA